MLEQYLEPAFNYRMTDIQAAVGLVQLGRLDEIVARAPRAWPPATSEPLADVDGLQPVRRPAYGTTNYQSFWVLLPDDFPVARDDAAGAGSTRPASRPAAASWPPTSSRPTPALERLRCRSPSGSPATR